MPLIITSGKLQNNVPTRNLTLILAITAIQIYQFYMHLCVCVYVFRHKQWYHLCRFMWLQSYFITEQNNFITRIPYPSFYSHSHCLAYPLPLLPSPIIPDPKKPLICSLSIIVSFHECYKNGIKWYATCFDWLFSHSIILWRFTWVVKYIKSSFHFIDR